MFRKRPKPVQFHSMSLLLERDGLKSKTSVFNSSLLANLLARYEESGFTAIEATHSKYCLCEAGKDEKVAI
ncbi:hypothetical protein SEA_PARADIDDLES_261 [Streptomyces phage Paradiddles]|jgi:hypothetical protein|uniref:Uncharacterized protein n=3 Tax=Samistivirus TaxID=2560220 RepID=A0A222Z0L3_9CAUD|nr:hypothetical protein FDI36_gp020 [Streptomyces phage NootNoot]YP_009610995.1 hypothetical protein FDI36_gp034 [Streptomyces phage NootNoot]YP_009611017.1 hypothetical protein FDI37_gp020 [Streptomyces phage Paradiddles]YP_009611211.1 hypothetical protein FDI37_gp034 [Streptomyces phage Paradiddles]YP_010103913.1 hypothetical protein KNU71_gp020 [Streptomyces phage Braelyn]YP_010104119.1 hypothetical protein KNU71_gp037 [Streptomyces phage Braelyn]UGL63021.1 hypothetical protein SEA_BARTHOL